MPVFNEARYVRQSLAQVRLHHDQILVIDDGSTDDTPRILADCHDCQGVNVIRHVTNQGYGRSLIGAFNWAAANGYDWVITIDCDLQHEPARIPDFIREIQTDRWDIISGSRYLRPDMQDDLPPADRRSINSTITCIINDLFQLNLTDSFCGFKAQRVSSVQSLHLDAPGYAFPMQFWPRAVYAGLRITEIPVRLIYNDPTRHFGGDLDNAADRLTHYLEVLNAEVQRHQAKAVVPSPR